MRAVIFSITFGLATAVTMNAVHASSLIDRYYTALHMDEVFSILNDEGVEAGRDMTDDGTISASPAWNARLERIYDIAQMDVVFRDVLSEFKEFEMSEDAIAFFETDLGRRIARLELDARVALASDGVEADMLDKVEQIRKDDPDRLKMYEEFIEVNALVDSNVSGALNANLEFYKGMASNPEFEGGLTEEFILTTVWEQEGEIREDMQDWTLSFSALAYSVLSEEELQSYIDISADPAGQKLNAALFAGFDKVFAVQSYELGRATAEFSIGDDT